MHQTWLYVGILMCCGVALVKQHLLSLISYVRGHFTAASTFTLNTLSTFSSLYLKTFTLKTFSEQDFYTTTVLSSCTFSSLLTGLTQNTEYTLSQTYMNTCSVLWSELQLYTMVTLTP